MARKTHRGNPKDYFMSGVRNRKLVRIKCSIGVVPQRYAIADGAITCENCKKLEPANG